MARMEMVSIRTSPGEESLDGDADGLTNSQEYLAGTDPKDRASAFRVTAATFLGNGIQITSRRRPAEVTASNEPTMRLRDRGRWSRKTLREPARSNSCWTRPQIRPPRASTGCD